MKRFRISRLTTTQLTIIGMSLLLILGLSTFNLRTSAQSGQSEQDDQEKSPIESDCGIETVSDEKKRELRESHRRFREEMREASGQGKVGVLPARANGSVTIRVFFHVINQGTGIANGDVPESMLDDQINVLNNSFNGTSGGVNTPFRFVKSGVTRTTNAAWYTMTPNSPEETAAKAALHVGGAGDLNLYTANITFNGWGWYPWDYTAFPLTDGVVCRFNTLPGGSAVGYGQGDTAVHEVGHWLGLYHTYENGCAAPGDEVADTPAEASGTFDCPTGRDTCPGGGVDPITNFMENTNNACMFRFTANQSTRMDNMHLQYRSRTFVHTATVANTSGHITTISHTLANGNPNAVLVVTPNFNPGGSGGTYNNHAIGVFYDGSKWAIFNQDIGAMSLTASFNVTVSPAANPQSFIHDAAVGNTESNFSTFNSTLTNLYPKAVLQMTPNWNPPGQSGVYHDHTIGVFYTGAQWAVFNQDLDDMIVGSSFNVRGVTVPGATEYVHDAASSNISNNWTVLDHPLLNNKPNAIVHATQNWNPPGQSGVYNNAHIGVWYTEGRWAVFNQNLAEMTVGASFNISLSF